MKRLPPLGSMPPPAWLSGQPSPLSDLQTPSNPLQRLNFGQARSESSSEMTVRTPTHLHPARSLRFIGKLEHSAAKNQANVSFSSQDSQANRQPAHILVRPLKDNAEVSPAPVSKFAPRSLINISNFNPKPAGASFTRQTSIPAFKSVNDFIKSLDPQRSSSFTHKASENPEVPTGIQTLLGPDMVRIPSRLGVVKQESCDTNPLELTQSLSLSSINPASELLRSQSMRVTERSDAFKSYARPLVLNQTNQTLDKPTSTLSDQIKSPFNEDQVLRPREIKREMKLADSILKHRVTPLPRDSDTVTKQQAALEAGLQPGILPSKRQHASTLNKAILAKKILEQIEHSNSKENVDPV